MASSGHMGKCTEVGKYRLKDEVLGRGFFGEVRTAVHIETGKEYACKIFNLSRSVESDILAIVKNEVFVLRILRHKHIIRVYEHIRVGGKSYVFMEKAPGKDLVNIVSEKGAFVEEDFRAPFKTIVETVMHLHSRGIYHGDLKPENVVMDENGFITLVDFGTSQRRGADKSPRSSSFVGTPHFLPPECISCSDWCLNQVDIWGLGVLMYVCLAGVHPFTGNSKQEVFDSVVQHDLRFPEHISLEAVDLMSRMLAYQPSDRITLEGVLEADWVKNLKLQSTDQKNRLKKETVFYDLAATRNPLNNGIIQTYTMESLLTMSSEFPKPPQVPLLHRKAGAGPSAKPKKRPPPSSHARQASDTGTMGNQGRGMSKLVELRSYKSHDLFALARGESATTK